MKQRRRNFGGRSKAIGVCRCLRHANIRTNTRIEERVEDEVEAVDVDFVGAREGEEARAIVRRN